MRVMMQLESSRASKDLIIRLCVLLAVTVFQLSAATLTLNFEGFPDSTLLTSQYSGVTFTNSIILTAGLSLNDSEFPPHSGVNVVSDNGGPITIAFMNPIVAFSGYFTYVEPLTLTGFNAGGTQVVSAMSAFSSNDALFGDPGSSPNELIKLNFLGGLSKVIISGDPTGNSFVLDDATLTTSSSAVPEPSSLGFLLCGGAVFNILVNRRKRKHRF